MFTVTAEETIDLAAIEGMSLTFKRAKTDSHFARKDVSWTWLAFERNDQSAKPVD